MRVLMLAIRMDVNDWATSFIPQKWVPQLAQHVEALNVLALEVGDPGQLPHNVHVYSMGKAPGVGRVDVLRNFYQEAAPLMRRCDVVFVHMIPRYALVAAPLAIPQRKRIVLWYTHRNASNDLKTALPLVHRVATAVPSSFPLKSDKVRALGHGIDTRFFAPSSHVAAAPLIVHVARLQQIKGQDVLLRALREVPDARAAIIGDVPVGEDPYYLSRLHTQARKYDLFDRVSFTGGQSLVEVRDWYTQAAVAVNLSPPGLFDKAALESMAMGVPTLVSNPAFDNLLGTHVEMLRTAWPLDPAQIAEQLKALLGLSLEQRAHIGAELREAVVETHSIGRLMPRLASVLKTGEPE